MNRTPLVSVFSGCVLLALSGLAVSEPQSNAPANPGQPATATVAKLKPKAVPPETASQQARQQVDTAGKQPGQPSKEAAGSGLQQQQAAVEPPKPAAPVQTQPAPKPARKDGSSRRALMKSMEERRAALRKRMETRRQQMAAEMARRRRQMLERERRMMAQMEAWRRQEEARMHEEEKRIDQAIDAVGRPVPSPAYRRPPPAWRGAPPAYYRRPYPPRYGYPPYL